MNFLADFDHGAIGQQHPNRDLQPFSASIDDTDRAISPLGPSEDSKSGTIKRVERIEDLDFGAIGAQGIVGADVIIPMSTTSFLPAVSIKTTRAGFIPSMPSSCP